MSIIRYTRPSLAAAIDDLREILSPEELAELDSRESSAAQRVHDALQHVEVWPLAGREGLWVKLPDLAKVKGVRASVLREQVGGMLASGEATEADLVENVRDNAVDASGMLDMPLRESASKLTRSPTGVTMLSWRLAKLCAMKSDGPVGVEVRRAMLAVEEEHAGLEQYVQATAIVKARQMQQHRAPAIDEINLAREMRLAGDRAGARTILRRIAGLPALDANENGEAHQPGLPFPPPAEHRLVRLAAKLFGDGRPFAARDFLSSTDPEAMAIAQLFGRNGRRLGHALRRAEGLRIPGLNPIASLETRARNGTVRYRVAPRLAVVE